MRVIIAGAGEVGTNIAASLADAHEVVVIDPDPAKIESLTYSLDVLAIEGSVTSPDTLREAGIQAADLFIVSASEDEMNLIGCATAKMLADPFTIARVKSTEYLRTWEANTGAYGVDFMVCTDLLTAEHIFRMLGLPAASDTDYFANGRIRMAEFPITEESTLANKTVREADRYDEVTFVALVRDDDTIVVDGRTEITPGGKLVVIGTPAGIRRFAMDVDPVASSSAPDQIMIVGGSRIGYHTARLLEETPARTRLIEQAPARARELAESLAKTTVFEHDATDVEFLLSERIEDVDAIVTALGSDEQNLLMAVLAKQLGAARAIAVVETGAYAGLFEAVGIDVAVNPRVIIAEEIVRFALDIPAEKISLIGGDQGTVLELEVTADGDLVGRTVSEVTTDVADPMVVGAITRRGEVIIPRGDTEFAAGDHLVLVVTGDVDTITSRL